MCVLLPQPATSLLPPSPKAPQQSAVPKEPPLQSPITVASADSWWSGLWHLASNSALKLQVRCARCFSRAPGNLSCVLPARQPRGGGERGEVSWEGRAAAAAVCNRASWWGSVWGDVISYSWSRHCCCCSLTSSTLHSSLCVRAKRSPASCCAAHRCRARRVTAGGSPTAARLR